MATRRSWQTGDPLTTGDPCPTTPGATADGCVVTGRLLRLAIGTGTLPKTAADGTPLITDWCQQYPSHSIGALQFGTDGFLYASAGDGASFNFADYGQDGNPVNPCGDPPGGPGTVLTPPTAEGGALRSQDIRTTSDPLGLDGTIIRIDPATGAGAPGNPLAASSDANARRVVANGLRNPFRFTFRPGTSDLYIGDVGWDTWEEIDRVPVPADTSVDNLGWPCYEGTPRQPCYDNLNLSICENLYSAGAGAVTAPTLSYRHARPGRRRATAARSARPRSPGWPSTRAAATPRQYNGALFFTDYSRRCMWTMRPNAQGSPTRRPLAFFSALPGGAVNLEIGPARRPVLRRLRQRHDPANPVPDGQPAADRPSSPRTRPVATSP